MPNVGKGRGAKLPEGHGQPARTSALVVINRKSGTVRSRGADAVRQLVEERLAPRFQPLSVILADGDILPEVRRARDGKTHDVIIAGGGDGTITSVASELLGSDRVMAALPLGTMNLFVQALGFTPVLEEALDQLGTATPKDIDVGLANDQLFLHQISFGLQPRMARLRERIGYSSRLTKMLAAARAVIVLAARPKMVRVLVDADGEMRRVRTPLLIISNNPLGRSDRPALPVSLEAGVVGLYALERFSVANVIRLGLDYLGNRIGRSPVVDARTAAKVVIARASRRLLRRTRKARGLLASMDGEVLVIDSPVTVTVKPKALRVLARSSEPS
jgi:diacylglycerol kinase family enzyme